MSTVSVSTVSVSTVSVSTVSVSTCFLTHYFNDGKTDKQCGDGTGAFSQCFGHFLWACCDVVYIVVQPRRIQNTQDQEKQRLTLKYRCLVDSYLIEYM